MIFWLLAVAWSAELVVGTDAPTVQAAVDLAKDGDVVVLPEGRWPGPVRVNKRLTVTSRGGTLVSTGVGHTVILEAPGAVLDGLIVQGSGDDLRGPDACVRVEPGATGAEIRGAHLSDCLFGVWIHETAGVKVLESEIIGRPEARDSDKGNGIHLFDATELEIRGNVVKGARDGIYVAATEQSFITDNDVSEQRFGIHYMFSYDNTISGNIARNNTAGIALMGSFRLKVFDNVATDNQRQGMLFRDLQHCDIHHNDVARNGEGFFFYSSLDNDIHHNVLRGNLSGARIWAGTERNKVWANAFIANGQQIVYISPDDLVWGTEDGGNYWSDHMAWDQDGDGLADRPYRADASTAALLYRWPAAVLLLASPALELLSALSERVPLLRVPTIVDLHPLIQPAEGLP
jgi:nitrous oxidase accessory protein